MIKTLCRVLPFIAFFLCITAGSSVAQQAPDQPAAAAASAPDAAPQGAPSPAASKPAASPDGQKGSGDMGADSLIKDEPMDNLEDTYQKTTVTNLSKLYWALGMLDLKDDMAIEQFLQINDCDLFQKYIHNDFEWNKIKQATRKMLGKDMALFPTRYEIIIPIDVGAYDQEKAQFLVSPDSQMNNTKRMDVAPNYGVPVCGSLDEIKNYPRNMILTLVRPFTFKVIPASAELAELYINSTQDVYSNFTAKYAVNLYKREAYLRLKVRIMQYIETVDFHGKWRAVVIATIEGYDVYADRDKLKLLYSLDMTKEDLHHRHHRRTDDATDSTTKGNAAGSGNDQETPTDSTTGDNTSEIDGGAGVAGSAVDPGGMGTSSPTDTDADVVTHGTDPAPAPDASHTQPPAQ